jgi:hypothetical protein
MSEKVKSVKHDCDCHEAPNQQEVGGHTRYCEAREEINEEDMSLFERQLAQAILGALEYRGFYDCGKYLDASLIEHIRPLITTRDAQIRREAFVEGVEAVENSIMDIYHGEMGMAVTSWSPMDYVTHIKSLKQDAQEGLETKE